MVEASQAGEKTRAPRAVEDVKALNLELLDALVTRQEVLIDRRMLLAYDPRSIQATEATRHYPGEDTLAMMDEAQRRAERRMTDARARARRAGVELPLDSLVAINHLTELEQDILHLALAPVLDASFRKRIALFKDNMLLSYADVDLALALQFESRRDRMAARDVFLPWGRLVRGKLIELTMPRDALTTDHLLASEMRVPDRVVNLVLGHEVIDRSIALYSRLTVPEVPLDRVILPKESIDELLSIIDHYATFRADATRMGLRDVLPVGRGLVIQVSGPSGTGKTLLVQAIATRLGARLLVADGGKLAIEDQKFDSVVDNLFFEARQRNAVLCLDNCEALFSNRNPKQNTVYRHFEEHSGVVVLVTNEAERLDFTLERWVAWHLKIEVPDAALRERIWNQHLPQDAPTASDVDIPLLAQQFEFSGGQIRNAVLIAMNRALARGGSGPVIDHALLEKSSYAQLRADMEEYSIRSKVKLTLSDLILPDNEMRLVREVIDAAKMRTFVMTHWGFGKRLSTGKGLAILFNGEPGTGKTLCAEILAGELGLQLFRVSIPRVVSKWVGETEKNISKIFQSARASHSVMLFDEADALFTSRVKVESSIDRFANMETNLLLQEIERFEGICILTTNHEKNMDEAFRRRLQFKIDFPFPDDKQRGKIWRTLIPKEAPIADDIDFDLLGKNFEITGGYIKNAIVRAAYRAAVHHESITMRHIEESAEQECKNAGKIFRSINSRDDHFPL